MSSTRNRLGLVAVVAIGSVLVAALATSGSSSKDRPKTEPSASETSSGEETSSNDPAKSSPGDADAILQRAIDKLISADTAKFNHRVQDGSTSSQSTGSYRLSARRSSAELEISQPGLAPGVMRYRVIGRDVYFSDLRWPKKLGRCWLRYDTYALVRSFGQEGYIPSEVPPNIVALTTARGTEIAEFLQDGTPAEIIGTVDLTSSATLFGPGAIRFIKNPNAGARLKARFTLTNGEIRSWQLEGTDFAEALERAGSPAKVFVDRPEAAQYLHVSIAYERAGFAEVNVKPPRPALVMTPQQLQSNQGCSAVQ